MTLRSMWFASLAAAWIPAAAMAGPAPGSAITPSAFAVPVLSAPEAPELALTTSGAPNPEAFERPRSDAVRYRPRRRDDGYGYRDRGPQSPFLTSVHAGFFDPSGGFDNGLVLGFRSGPLIDPHIQLGAGVDWWHKSEAQTLVIDEGEFPIGGTFERQQEISRFSANLFPIMGFVQVSGDENMSVIPYGGAGIGYEALFLSGSGRDEFGDPFDFDADYGGLGWQVWGGVAIPMSGRSRVTGEVFGNFAELSRDVEDPSTGETIREIVDLDGIGARIGVTWGF